MLLNEVLIGEFSTIDGLSASAITGGEVTTLKMKCCNCQSRYRSMETRGENEVLEVRYVTSHLINFGT